MQQISHSYIRTEELKKKKKKQHSETRDPETKKVRTIKKYIAKQSTNLKKLE